ncbi:DNA-binding protein [Chryseobacterium sp. MD-1]
MDFITKRDLELFRTQLMSDLNYLFENKLTKKAEPQLDWLRSKTIRKMLNISPATLQNLRIKGNVRYKKIMGSYYYNRFDIQNLFENEY